MSITYRKLEEKDLETFIRMRITQLREEGATEDLDLAPALTEPLFPGWRWMTIKSWERAACHLWRNRRISAAPQDGSGFCPVCIQIRLTGAGALQRNSSGALWRKPGSTAAVRCRLQPRIWACCCIRISASLKTAISCSISSEMKTRNLYKFPREPSGSRGCCY